MGVGAVGARFFDVCVDRMLGCGSFGFKLGVVELGISRSTSSKTQLPNASVFGLNPMLLHIFSSASVFLG